VLGELTRSDRSIGVARHNLDGVDVVWRDPQSDADRGPVKGQRFLFTSKEMDEETGLYYFGARYFDAAKVRWASTDPAFPIVVGLSPHLLSPYVYARFSPVSFMDPDGMLELPSWQEVVASTGGAVVGVMEGLTTPVYPASFGCQEWAQGRQIGMSLGSGLGMFLAIVGGTGGIITGPGEAVIAPVAAGYGTSRLLTAAFAAEIGRTPHPMLSEMRGGGGGDSPAQGQGPSVTQGAPKREPWRITKEGTERTVRHQRFGTFHKSKSDGLWWSKDQAGHGGSKWKVFEETKGGLKWKADADEFGDFIVEKHKSDVGRDIPWSELGAVK